MSYITVADLDNKGIVGNTNLTNYIKEADKEIEDLAEQLGVRDPDNIETDPIHNKLRRFGVVFIYMRICENLYGLNNSGPTAENKYFVGWNMNRDLYKEVKGQISKEMITGSVDETRDRANNMTAIIFPG